MVRFLVPILVLAYLAPFVAAAGPVWRAPSSGAVAVTVAIRRRRR